MLSRQAREILSVLRTSEGHMTAEEVYRACKEAGMHISVASVYRNLARLSEQGVIRRFAVSGEPDRFDKTVSPHEHVICSRCGRAMDVSAEADLKALLEKTYGVKLTSYELTMRTLCGECGGEIRAQTAKAEQEKRIV